MQPGSKQVDCFLTRKYSCAGPVTCPVAPFEGKFIRSVGSSELIPDVAVPQGMRVCEVPPESPHAIDKHARLSETSLVKNRKHRGIRLRGDVGDHYILNVILEEEPCLLPRQGPSHGVGIAHGRDAHSSVTDTTDECFFSDIVGVLAVEGRGIVVDGDTWNEVPVPDSGYIFVLIALEVCVNDAVGEMETKKLQGMSVKILIWGEARTHIL